MALCDLFQWRRKRHGHLTVCGSGSATIVTGKWSPAGASISFVDDHGCQTCDPANDSIAIKIVQIDSHHHGVQINWSVSSERKLRWRVWGKLSGIKST